LMNQWAETHKIARGRPNVRSIVRPNSFQHSVYRLCSSVFIGLPCPMNTAGILVAVVMPRAYVAMTTGENGDATEPEREVSASSDVVPRMLERRDAYPPTIRNRTSRAAQHAMNSLKSRSSRIVPPVELGSELLHHGDAIGGRNT
jgi:hypothetical protein